MTRRRDRGTPVAGSPETGRTPQEKRGFSGRSPGHDPSVAVRGHTRAGLTDKTGVVVCCTGGWAARIICNAGWPGRPGRCRSFPLCSCCSVSLTASGIGWQKKPPDHGSASQSQNRGHDPARTEHHKKYVVRTRVAFQPRRGRTRETPMSPYKQPPV